MISLRVFLFAILSFAVFASTGEIKEPNISTLADNNIVNTTDRVKELAQTGVPFIDALSIIANPTLRLSGTGLYSRAQTGCIGLITLQLATYNYGVVSAQDPSEDAEDPDSVDSTSSSSSSGSSEEKSGEPSPPAEESK